MLKVYKYKVTFEDVEDNVRFVGHSGFQLMEENEAQNKKEILTWDDVFSRNSKLYFF